MYAIGGKGWVSDSDSDNDNDNDSNDDREEKKGMIGGTKVYVAAKRSRQTAGSVYS